MRRTLVGLGRRRKSLPDALHIVVNVEFVLIVVLGLNDDLLIFSTGRRLGLGRRDRLIPRESYCRRHHPFVRHHLRGTRGRIRVCEHRGHGRSLQHVPRDAAFVGSSGKRIGRSLRVSPGYDRGRSHGLRRLHSKLLLPHSPVALLDVRDNCRPRLVTLLRHVHSHHCLLF